MERRDVSTDSDEEVTIIHETLGVNPIPIILVAKTSKQRLL